ncbi:MAG: hypothetical protein HRU35_07915 [Rickettsiaceae bacterium]|nr:hypothetical protein [Rickettsiaceae bacterium]
MFALSVSELEKLLKGLVIISSAPDSSWIAESINTIKKYNLPDVSKAIKKMNDEPTDNNLKLLFYECIPYLFEPNQIAAGKVILEQNQYNIMTRLWGHNIFHPQFKYQWIPDKLPTLIIGSSSDKTLPMLLFTRAKEFQKSNIKMVDLQDVGHYPWLAKFDEISNLMLEFMVLVANKS